MPILPRQYDCTEVDDLLFDYTEQNLTQDIRMAMQVHFMTCRSCNGRLEAYRASTEAARTVLRAQSSPLPAGLRLELLAVLAAEGKR